MVSGDYEVAAFCGDECRGVATVESVPGEEVSYYYMRIRSNVAEGEEMTFKCYDRKLQKEVEISNVLSFAEGTVAGYPSELYGLQEKTYDIVAGASVGGSVSGSGSYVLGEEVALTATPEEGYHFVEWSDGTSVNPYVWTVAGDKELSAVFEPNTYTLTYLVDGEVWQTLTVAYGSEIQAPDSPEKEGHTFSGWSEIPPTMPARDVEVTGNFTVNSYTLTYLVDGEVWQTLTVAYGSEIQAPDSPEKEGHTFCGWSEIPSTMPARDVEVIGSFTVNNYTLTYLVDGEVYATVEVPYGSEVVPIDEPKKEGYVFSGWQNVPETMPAHDVEVRGSFSTGIQGIVRSGELVDVYDVRGVLLHARMDSRDLFTLPKGLYVVKGQKFLIK